MSVHLVTQRHQPYGSTRRCCEMCGLAIYPHINKVGELFTTDEKVYERSPFSCNKREVSR